MKKYLLFLLVLLGVVASLIITKSKFVHQAQIHSTEAKYLCDTSVADCKNKSTPQFQEEFVYPEANEPSGTLERRKSEHPQPFRATGLIIGVIWYSIKGFYSVISNCFVINSYVLKYELH